MEKIGMIGVGQMGKGMVKNLVKSGCEVFAFDPLPQAQEKARELGAKVLDSPREVGAKAEVVLSSLPTSQAVAEAINGDDGALKGMEKGKIICDMSTTAVTVEKELYATAKEKGVSYLGCPVSGGPAGAENATMSIMVGGDREAYEKALPVLERIGGKIFYLGEIGSGQIVKMCNNIVLAVTAVALSEAFSAGVKAGVSAKTLCDVFRVSTANSRTLEIFGENLINGTYEQVIFACSHMHKDAKLFIEMAGEQQMPVPVSSMVYQLYNAAMRKGWGPKDMSAIAGVIEELGQIKIPSLN